MPAMNHAPVAEKLSIWVVYDSPADFPGQFVARKWLNDAATSEVLQADSLQALRELLPAGLYCLPRSQEDDAVIVESWF